MNSRRKGKDGELEFAEALRALGFDARRGRQFHGGPDSPDVVSEALAPYHFEVKRTEALRLYDAMAQAIAEGGGKVPVVAHRRNRGGWLVVLRIEDFARLARGAAHADSIHALQAGGPKAGRCPLCSPEPDTPASVAEKAKAAVAGLGALFE